MLSKPLYFSRLGLAEIPVHRGVAAHERDFWADSLPDLIRAVDDAARHCPRFSQHDNAICVWVRMDPCIWDGRWRTILAFQACMAPGETSTSFADFCRPPFMELE